MFYGVFGFLYVNRVCFEGFPQNSRRPHPDIEQSDVFFFLSSERNLLVLAKTLGYKLSYLGILFRLLSLEIQGGLETLGYKDTVYTRGLAPLQ